MKKIYYIAAFSLAFSLLSQGVCHADNPVVQTMYTTDPAPMVYNGTCYLYTGHDEDKSTWYTMNDWRCYSSTDMVNWTDHGSPLSYRTFSWAKGDAWAGQCIPRNGKFYYYVPVTQKSGGMAIGVAVSNSPTGPFVDALGHPLAFTGTGDIDPTVFIDDNGQAYLYWGNPNLFYVKLNQDMISYSGSIVQVPLTTSGFGARTGKSDKRLTLYEEGPWFYKRNGMYYMVYAAGGIPEYISYSTSKNPTGPWTYRGVIMPSQGGSFTNHPGVIDFKGKSYFFYHNGALPGGGGFTRSVCIEEFKYNPDGTFPTINMTKTGVSGTGNLNPYVRNEAETICWESNVKTENCSEGGMDVCNITNNSWIKVKGVNFGSGATSFDARVASANAGGNIELHLDSPTGKLIGTCPVKNTGGWQSWVTNSCKVNKVSGIHDLYLKFTGSNSSYLFNVDYWQFGGGNINPPNPSSGVLNNGWYRIKNVHAEKYLQVADNIGNASQNVELDSASSNAGQKWYLNNIGNGLITLKSALGNFMLDVYGGANNDGTNIEIYNAYGHTPQQFSLKASSSGNSYVITTMCSNGTKALDDSNYATNDGANVCEWSCTGGDNQSWTFEPAN